jgi:hypothetical protein
MLSCSASSRACPYLVVKAPGAANREELMEAARGSAMLGMAMPMKGWAGVSAGVLNSGCATAAWLLGVSGRCVGTEGKGGSAWWLL